MAKKKIKKTPSAENQTATATATEANETSLEEISESGKTVKKTMPREAGEVVFYGLALLMFFRVFVFQNFQIPTASMENTLLIGDHITANTFMFNGGYEWEKKILPFRDIRRGDVIVFKYPIDVRQDWIKRCIGVPGDKFEIKQHRIIINGQVLDEAYPFYKKQRGIDGDDRDRENRYYPLGYNETKPGFESPEYLPEDNKEVSLERIKRLTRYYLREYYKGRGLDGPTYERIMARLEAAPPDQIPEGFYFMMGDNRNNSFDSRGWGMIPGELVHGRAWFVWWSYGADVNNHKREGADRVTKYGELIWTFWSRTRWDSCFKLIK